MIAIFDSMPRTNSSLGLPDRHLRRYPRSKTGSSARNVTNLRMNAIRVAGSSPPATRTPACMKAARKEATAMDGMAAATRVHRNLSVTGARPDFMQLVPEAWPKSGHAHCATTDIRRSCGGNGKAMASRTLIQWLTIRPPPAQEHPNLGPPRRPPRPRKAQKQGQNQVDRNRSGRLV